MSDKTTKYHSVGRFDYVEPMNLNLTDPDNMVINKPEDYSISVNLEVEIPSRFYSENNEVKLMASSDNGTLSFFGGTDVGPTTDTEKKNRGYLTTSWTDIATTNVDKGNKECLGIESINIAYTPNFFPIVTIRFVDVRGASLFMPQEKAYQVMTKEKGYDPKVPFDGASVFKALFSMPCPIFKLTVKGFYGRPVTYKLIMSKFSSEFDSDNGNFIANVEFAGYMYGIYTELPMSFIALAPYLDNLEFWEKRKFTFRNGVQIPTIPDLIERIGEAAKNAPQEALESAEGKKFVEANKLLSVFKKIRETFPFKNGWYHFDNETDDNSKYGIGVADNNINKIVNDKPVLKEGSENILSNLNSCSTHEQQREVFYKVLNGTDRTIPNGNIFSLGSDGTYLSNFVIDENIINNYMELLKSAAEDYGRTEYGNYFDKYITDFNVILADIGFNKQIYYQNKLVNCGLPVYCLLNNSSGKDSVYGIDFFNQDNKTYVIGYNGFKIKEGKDCTPQDIQGILEKCNVTKQNNKSYTICRIATNTFKWLEEDIDKIEKALEKQKAKVKEQQSIEETKLLQFPLTIENVYHIIFAHIETFMTIYYRHLKNISSDDDRKKLINNVLGNLADVPILTNKIEKIQDIPPFPTFIDKTEEEGDKITWPCKLLNNKHIEETKFVEDIVDAALQLGNKLEEVKRKNEEIAKDTNQRQYSTGTESRIPSTILDFFVTENPYASIYKDYKNNPQDNILEKIWLTFILRCAYFGVIFKKYRMVIQQSKSTDKTGSDNVEMAKSYFAMSEASNIKKVFGDNIGRDILVNLTKDDSLNEFTKSLANYFTGNNVQTLQNYSSLFTAQDSKWNINFNETFKIDGDYVALPVNNIDKSKYSTEINEHKINTNDYIILKNNGEIVTENVSGITLNRKPIITTDINFFKNFKTSIISDDVVKECSMDKIDIFLDGFYNEYLGRRIKQQDGYYKTDNGGILNMITSTSPYKIGNEEKIFIVNNGSKSYDDLKKENSYDVSLQETVNEKPIKYTSIINGMKCVDPVNVITTGSTTGNSTTHFPFEMFVPEIKFLNDDATIYDKAYLFLFSLPVITGYNVTVTYSNMMTVPKVCLLREGAFYYWQDNLETIKSHFNKSYGSGMGRDNIPIVINEVTKTNVAPTLYLTDEGREQEYLTWGSKAKIPLNRRNYLVEYFKKWVNGDFQDIVKIKASNTGLSNSEMKTVADLYLSEVLYIDVTTEVERDLYVPVNSNMTCEEECIKFFVDSYDKFRGYIKILYPEDNMLSSPPPLDLTDSEEGLKSNKDFKLSIYLTLQTLYNKFVAGNKLERWQFGKNESDFNNFMYMDSYFNLIGQRLVFNGTRIQHMLSDVSDTVSALANSNENLYKGSVYEFFAKLCQENGCNLIALPIRPYTINKESNSQKLVWDLFDAIPYHKIKADDSSCFVSMYTYKPSEHLDNQNDNGLYAYKQDGFNIDPKNEKELPRQFKSDNIVEVKGDINANGSSDMPTSLQRFSEKGSPRIPSFAVTYAKQNQSIFKKITVGTANPQITEPAIAMTLNIASKSDSTPRDSVIFGQDLYSVYSNYSYTCDVEMMGCAPIMPLMYFQLNNIPMFKGAYQIIHVEHNIVAGNMTTRFKGVRVNKNAIPFVRASYVYNDDLGNRLYENDVYTEGEPITDNKNNDTDNSTPSSTPSYGKETNIDGTEEVNERNPLVCLSAAHSETRKPQEHRWSVKIVNRIIEKIEEYNNSKTEDDKIRFAVVNKSGKGYSGREVRDTYIQKYGSKGVISIVPHWNGAKGNYYLAMTGGGDNHKPQRQDSLELCRCIVEEAKKVKNSVKFNGMFDGAVSIKELGAENTDWAAQLDCACVLTENWFADYKSKGNEWATEPPAEHTGRYWLESEEGIETIANLHFNAIVNYIKSLNGS